MPSGSSKSSRVIFYPIRRDGEPIVAHIPLRAQTSFASSVGSVELMPSASRSAQQRALRRSRSRTAPYMVPRQPAPGTSRGLGQRHPRERTAGPSRLGAARVKIEEDDDAHGDNTHEAGGPAPAAPPRVTRPSGAPPVAPPVAPLPPPAPPAVADVPAAPPLRLPMPPAAAVPAAPPFGQGPPAMAPPQPPAVPQVPPLQAAVPLAPAPHPAFPAAPAAAVPFAQAAAAAHHALHDMYETAPNQTAIYGMNWNCLCYYRHGIRGQALPEHCHPPPLPGHLRPLENDRIFVIFVNDFDPWSLPQIWIHEAQDGADAQWHRTQNGCRRLVDGRSYYLCVDRDRLAVRWLSHSYYKRVELARKQPRRLRQ
ncbi:uncharacterized protein SCHCODRAFT_02671579 [Schizophyllum commune H4-8]|nr:uncharacterized protein SCHCODRAFT_02671579 [Schizophyllum commune H4-8]KAI5887582.1 hypothetical protein SCHCODRAFT_02671579 [Schizophyllum commune H4-8]